MGLRRAIRFAALAVASLVACASADDEPAEDIGAPGCAATLALSSLTSCVQLDDGEVSCFGWGWCGERGDGTASGSRAHPEPVLGLTEVRALKAGPWGFCAVRQDATSWCWGVNEGGRLGDPATSPSCDQRGAFLDEPTRTLDLVGVVDIDLGSSHACAVFDDGTVGCWGDNASDKLGGGTEETMTSAMVPVDVAGAREIHASYNGTCALLADATVSCWGQVLGLGSPATPTDAGLTDVTKLSVHSKTYYALRADHTLWTWGDNDFGQLGIGTEGDPQGPVQIDSLADVIDVAAGGRHACALIASGEVWCWGANDNSQIAPTGGPGSSRPIRFDGIPLAAAIYSGQEHVCSVARDGSVHCWGCNCCFQLGSGPKTECQSAGGGGSGPLVAEITCPSTERTSFYGCAAASGDGPAGVWIVALILALCWARRRRSPTCLSNAIVGAVRFAALAVVSLCACVSADDDTAEEVGAPGCVAMLGLSTLTSCVQFDDGEVSCYGWGRCGELGDGTASGSRVRSEPVLGLTDVRALKGGPGGFCAVRQDATSWCWGGNDSERLGDPASSGSCDTRGPFIDEPTRTLDLVGVVDIDLGISHACAVFDDGTVGCWGDNENDQLGGGTEETMTSAMVPVDVAGALEIHAGYQGTCALLADRTVSCWGLVLGLGSPAAPTDAGLTDITKLAAYGNTYYALRADQSLWAWGGNEFGELGIGTEGGQQAPVQIDSLADVIDVASGGHHACALIASGEVWCWGGNENGEIAPTGILGSSSPIRFEGIPLAAAIYSGQEHICSVARDGSVHCWGCNCCYQLGSGPKVPCENEGGGGSGPLVAEIACPSTERKSFYGCAAASGDRPAGVGIIALILALCWARRRRESSAAAGASAWYARCTHFFGHRVE